MVKAEVSGMMPAAIAFSLVLFAAAGTLAVMHLRAWRRRDDGALNAVDLEFFRRRYLRRSAVSGLIGLIAVLLPAVTWIENPLTALPLMIGVLLLVGGILVLAFADWLASRRYFAALFAKQSVQRAKLLAEVRAFHDRRERKQGPASNE